MTATVIFEAAARHLNFTTAAQELNVTQAAVSRQMRHLEDYFGKYLFIRESNGLSLTLAGEAFYHDIEDPLIRIANAAEKARRRLKENEVVFTSTLGYAEHWLTPKLAEFHRQNSAIKVRLLATDSDVSHIEFAVDGMFGINYGESVNTNNAILLCDELVYPVCSPDYLQGFKVVSKPENLLEASLISIAPEHWLNISDDPTTWQTWFKSCGVSVDEISSSQSFNNDAFAVQAALRGQGVTLGWHHLVCDYIEAGQLVKLTTHVYASGRRFYLFRNYIHPTPALDIFERWVSAMYPASSSHLQLISE